MAYINDVTQNSIIDRTLTAGTRLIESLAERRAMRRVYRTTLGELQTLSNRELADLGLHRSELKRIAWDAAQNATAQ